MADLIFSGVSLNLKDMAYYKTGGSAREIFCPRDPDALQKKLQDWHRDKIPFFVLGGGTNSLVMDEPWPGGVLSLKNFTALEVLDKGQIRAGAGVSNTDFARFALDRGLIGAGWMMGLPGQIGGTARMNARCYGGELGSITAHVLSFTRDGHHAFTRPAREVFWGYKHTAFMENQEIIGEVVFQLTPGSPGELAKEQSRMEACLSDRIQKHQFDAPSCGCVFKNDYSPGVGLSSGLLLEKSGVQGMGLGGAQVSPYHSNFVFNKNCATARDILLLTLAMRQKVWDTFGVWLEYEMEILGQLPLDLVQAMEEKRSPAYRVEALERLRAR
jgi:UDP-N-acetylmuramate dehydrogenase